MLRGDRKTKDDEKYAELIEQRDKIVTELAGLRAEVKALRTERDRTAEVNGLAEQIETLKRERDRLVEAQDRKLRETEHRVGLLRTQQEQDVEHKTREAVLKVREENLAADKNRFKAEMDFQREHLQREVSRVEEILKTVLDHLPSVAASYRFAVGGDSED